ncbi:uncharacterized protein [Coffea arabica]|uniref:Helitron helicase-like domain-containing protein n=1 Tax=Coffea arabica TaxID=13443 RepID=A0ABM4VQD8_COFAR
MIQSEEQVFSKFEDSKEYVSMREYYAYRFQIRKQNTPSILNTARSFQQYVVDMYVKIERQRLDFHRKRQKLIRTEQLQGVMDSVVEGEAKGSNLGQRVILPASFIGGPRDMKRRYVDAMSLVQKYGKPDLFLTMTCNPSWPEIKKNMLPINESQNRVDLSARVFHAKLELLKEELFKKEIFGKVAAYTYVVEFQKRGLPHAHFLIILHPTSKLYSTESYDQIVSVELPDPVEHKHLFKMVRKHMMHGPCGDKMPDNVFIHLQLRLENYQSLTFKDDDDLRDLMKNKHAKKSMLTEFFRMNATDETAKKLKCTYKEFLEYFVWYPGKKLWEVRKERDCIGRIVTANPTKGERYFLRLLLLNVKGPTSFNGVSASTFREAAIMRGLFESNNPQEQCLEEATLFHMPYSFRRLFATLLVYFPPADARSLWLKFKGSMSEDFA